MEMFKNYNAWDIKIEDFNKLHSEKEKVKFILKFGILAPSSHNAQPWSFQVSEDNISIYKDLKRHLKYSDPTGRMLYISVGAVIQNLIVAGEYFGYKTIIKYNEKEALGSDNAVADIIFKKGTQNNFEKTLINAIKKRASYRGRFLKKLPEKNLLNELKKIDTDNDTKLSLITDKDTTNKLSTIIALGMEEKMSEVKFRWELASWLRKNFTKKTDGMPGSGHEMSTLISLIAPWALRFINVSPVEKVRAKKRVNGFPAVGIIGTRNDNPIDWIKTGILLENLWLLLESKHYSINIMAAGIESSVARKKIAKIFNADSTVGETYLPQIFFGFGKPDHTTPHSPRRNLQKLIKNEKQ